jgi:tetratricopeptide (TPR) repeat protein
MNIDYLFITPIEEMLADPEIQRKYGTKQARKEAETFLPRLDGLSQEEQQKMRKLNVESRGLLESTPHRSVGTPRIHGNPFSLDTRGVSGAVSRAGATVKDNMNQQTLLEMAPELEELMQKQAAAREREETRQKYLAKRVPELVDRKEENIKDEQEMVDAEKLRFYEIGKRLISQGEMDEAKKYLQQAGLTIDEIEEVVDNDAPETADEVKQETEADQENEINTISNVEPADEDEPDTAREQIEKSLQKLHDLDVPERREFLRGIEEEIRWTDNEEQKEVLLDTWKRANRIHLRRYNLPVDIVDSLNADQYHLMKEMVKPSFIQGKEVEETFEPIAPDKTRNSFQNIWNTTKKLFEKLTNTTDEPEENKEEGDDEKNEEEENKPQTQIIDRPRFEIREMKNDG